MRKFLYALSVFILIFATISFVRSRLEKRPQPTYLPPTALTVDTRPTNLPPVISGATETLISPTESLSTAPSISNLTNPEEAIITRSMIATRAAQLAAEKMPGEYSWEEFRTCSTFVSAYLRQLSFPVDGPQGQYSSYPDPFPWSGTEEQVSWARRNFPQYVHDAPLIDFLEGKLWDKLAPGDILYLQYDVGHNGYNKYYHTVVLISYDKNNNPIFAELAGNMKNVSMDSSFEEMTSYYSHDGNGWHVEPYETRPGGTTPPLLITWIDPLAILNEGPLWNKSGVVAPNSDLINSTYDDLITINIFDGTASLWEKVNGVWSQVNLNGRSEFYAVTGRLLPANNTIEKTFLQNRKNEIYDGDYGVYLSNTGIYQHTWTPQMIAELHAFDYISGFGGLSGSTLTAIMVPQVYDKRGNLVDNWDYSSFTFHRIPDVVNQDMLLRVDLLKKANDPGSPDFGPIPVPQVYLSSGCINFDETTWNILETYLQNKLDSGRKVGIIFSYPNYDQNLLPTIDVFKSAFTGGEFNNWCFVSRGLCDDLDRRSFRKTYLE